jgi:putative membrane protein
MDSALLVNVLNAGIYAGLGMVIFVLGFVIVDRLTPYDLWKEIVEEKNMALALLVGAVSIGMCIIIAAAVH